MWSLSIAFVLGWAKTSGVYQISLNISKLASDKLNRKNVDGPTDRWTKTARKRET